MEFMSARGKGSYVCVVNRKRGVINCMDLPVVIVRCVTIQFNSNHGVTIQNCFLIPNFRFKTDIGAHFRIYFRLFYKTE